MPLQIVTVKEIAKKRNKIRHQWPTHKLIL